MGNGPRHLRVAGLGVAARFRILTERGEFVTTTKMCLTTCLLAIGSLCTASVTEGQDFPARTVRIITTEPGSSSDLVARLIAQGMSSGLGRQVIVENRAGGMVA